MTRRRRARRDARALVDDLGALADRLRSGSSLRQALVTFADQDASPLRALATELREGRALAPALHVAAQGDDTDVAAACCVLAVHAASGGDPLPAVRALADRLIERRQIADEARSLTTQSRLGARTILLLTPAFLLLIGVSDPRGLVGLFTDKRTRIAMACGLALQAAGAWWISAIVANAGGRAARVAARPGLRVLRNVFVGRPPPTGDEDVAWCCDLMTLVLDAGLSTTAAVSAAAPYVRGGFGDALRAGVAQTGTSLDRALDDMLGPEADEHASRFVRAVRSSLELGVPLAPPLRSLASEIREARRIRTSESIRRASIRVLVPLGTLVLPAFVLACLIPLFVGGLGGLSTV